MQYAIFFVCNIKAKAKRAVKSYGAIAKGKGKGKGMGKGKRNGGKQN